MLLLRTPCRFCGRHFWRWQRAARMDHYEHHLKQDATSIIANGDSTLYYVPLASVPGWETAGYTPAGTTLDYADGWSDHDLEPSVPVYDGMAGVPLNVTPPDKEDDR